MSLLTKKQVLLAKIETTEGTDAVPTAADNAILIMRDPDFKENIEELERNVNQVTLGMKPSIAGTKFSGITFQVEVAGSGVAGTAPRIGALLRACSHAETIGDDGGGNSSVVYDPTSVSTSTVTLYLYKDGLLHKMLGCRGSVKQTSEAGKIAVWEYTMKGLWVTPTDVALPTPTFESVVPPVVKSAALTYNGNSDLVVQQSVIDIANEVSNDADVNATDGIKNFVIVSRKPTLTINPEAVLVATEDYRGDQLTTPRAFSMTIGSAAGNRLKITAPKVNIVDITYGDRDGKIINDLTAQLAEDTGNDEVKFNFD